jgi:excisionase family DNA binding protein
MLQDTLWSKVMGALISISEFQQLVNVSRSTVYRLIEKGEIGCVHIGRSVRIPVEDVSAFLKRVRARSRPRIN